MNGINKSIFLWGLICLIGYGVYHFPWFGMNIMQPMPFWTILTVIGVVAMWKWVPNWKANKVFWVWAVIGVVGMVYHWAFFTQKVPALIPSAWAYWALLQAIGFLLTGYYWVNKNFWYGLGVLQALVFVACFAFANEIGMNQSILLALTTGLPLMYHAYTSK